MLDDEYDKKIKEAAEHYHPEYDETAWEKMSQLLDEHLPQKKKRRKIFFILPSLLLVAALVFFVVIKNGEKNSSISRQNISSKNNTEKALPEQPLSTTKENKSPTFTESTKKSLPSKEDETINDDQPGFAAIQQANKSAASSIDQNKNELALVLFGGINYYTGQFFDLKAITGAAHAAGAYAGFDLAHAAGNVPLQLHNWGADFACWCSYKYMNSGPGGISGIFVHEKHFTDKELNRFAGWWGYRRDKQFLMAPGFDPEAGAAGWQVSTSPIPLLALFKASMAIFDSAGGLDTLRQKSLYLTGYLEFLIQSINKQQGEEVYRIITPSDATARGCQLSVVCERKARAIFNYLAQNGVIGDWREPDVIRLSPVPLYNTFEDVYKAAGLMADALKAV